MAYDLGIEFENWGAGGSGNVGIASRMLECDLLNTFTDTDLILVCWSGWSREDRIRDYPDSTCGWEFVGNILNKKPMYPESWLANYWSASNDVVTNMTSIILARKSFPIAFEASISENIYPAYHLTPPYPLYCEHLPKHAFPWDYNTNTAFNGVLNGIDNHPDIKAHLEFVESSIYPSLGFELSQSTKNYFLEKQQKIEQYPHAKYKNFHDIPVKIAEILDWKAEQYGYFNKK